MGDRKPSEYYSYLKNILGEDAEKPEYKEILRQKFIQTLPPHLTSAIDLFDNKLSIEEIIEGADKGASRNGTIKQQSGDSFTLAKIEKKLETMSQQPNQPFAISDEIHSQISSLRR